MEKIILTLIAIIGVYISFKRIGIFHKIISIGICLSLLISWVNTPSFLAASMLLLSFFAVLTSCYGLSMKGLLVIERVIVSILPIILMGLIISKLLHWPSLYMSKLAIGLLIITYVLFTLSRKIFLKNETSFMLFWLVLGIFEILRFFNIY